MLASLLIDIYDVYGDDSGGDMEWDNSMSTWQLVGGCPEPQGVRLPDCPHLMSQHEEQVSKGSSVL